jgi:hypothetical protein
MNAVILDKLHDKGAGQFGANPAGWKLKTKRHVESNQLDMQLTSTNEELMVVVRINPAVDEAIAQFNHLAKFAINRKDISGIGDAAFLVRAMHDKPCTLNVRIQNALVSVGGTGTANS